MPIFSVTFYHFWPTLSLWEYFCSPPGSDGDPHHTIYHFLMNLNIKICVADKHKCQNLNLFNCNKQDDEHYLRMVSKNKPNHCTKVGWEFNDDVWLWNNMLRNTFISRPNFYSFWVFPSLRKKMLKYEAPGKFLQCTDPVSRTALQLWGNKKSHTWPFSFSTYMSISLYVMFTMLPDVQYIRSYTSVHNPRKKWSWWERERYIYTSCVSKYFSCDMALKSWLWGHCIFLIFSYC